MQNFKNFELYEPDAELKKKYATESDDDVFFLRCEDGRDWYEIQGDFADDTVKLMYDENGVIRAVVDKPVPQRGNIFAASMFNPVGMSVAEVSVLPERFEMDSGSWKFGTEGVYQDMTMLINTTRKNNHRQYNGLRSEAASEIVMLQACAETGRGNPDDEARTQVLRTYLADLRETDLTAAEPDWPAQP